MSHLERRKLFTSQRHIERRRKFYGDRLTNLLFPVKFIDEGNQLQKAEEILDSELGLTVWVNHFALRDSIDGVKRIFGQKSPTLSEADIVVPFAYHQYNLITKAFCNFFGIKACPLVIEDTVKKSKYSYLHVGDGMTNYIHHAVMVLNNGGIVPISPQEGRRPRLGVPDKRTFEFFRIITRKNGVQDYGVLFIGLSMPNVVDYDEVRGFNLFKKVEMRVGTVTTISQAEIEASNQKKTLDKWAFGELKKVTHPNYW